MPETEKERPGQGAPRNSLTSTVTPLGRRVTRETARDSYEHMMLDMAERNDELRKASNAQKLKEYIKANRLERPDPETTLDHSTMTEAEKEIHRNAAKLGAANRADQIVLAHRQKADQFTSLTREVSPVRSKLMKLADLENMAPTKPLIKGVLDLDSESWLIGQAGGFKSFVAVDWACHVAAGAEQWRGRKVAAGDVLYVVAEGARGFAKRVKAWTQHHQMTPDRLQILPMPVQAMGETYRVLSADWMALVDVATELKPALIVLDTQARMTLGLEENSSKEMGLWVEAVRALRVASGGCVLVVHHTGRNGGDARGSSTIDAAQDMEWKVERKAHALQAILKCEKSKDGDDRARFSFAMELVVVGQDEDGQDITSLVPGDALDAFEAGQGGIAVLDAIAAEGEWLSNQEWVLRTIGTIAAEGQKLAPATIRRTVNEARKLASQDPMPEGTFRSILKRLTDDGQVERVGQQYGLPDPGKNNSGDADWDSP